MDVTQFTETYTQHADLRARQRSIPEVACWLLREFGDRRPAGGGAWSYSFGKAGWRKLEGFMGAWPLKKMEQLRKTYMVEAADGEIITLAYR